MLSQDFLSEPNMLFNRLGNILLQLKKMGAHQAEASISEAVAFDQQCRQGKIIGTHHAEDRNLKLRAFIGKRSADISLSLDQLKDVNIFNERVIAMAKLAPEDPYCGLAENTAAIDQIKDVEIYDRALPDINKIRDDAIEAEQTALAHHGISNSEGSVAAWTVSQNVHMTSLGFKGVDLETIHHLSCVVLAQKNGKMERDYESYSTRFAENMPRPDKIGAKAAKRTLARLGAVKPKSCVGPVVYHPRVARSLLGHLSSAISGAAVARGASFLKNHMNHQIFPKNISVVDDPFRPRGLRSQAFDTEGVVGSKQLLVEEGRLKTWILDSPSARQLGLHSTGHANFGVPSPSNLWLVPSESSQDQLIADIENGLYVTELIGSGANLITGDYSRGCAGFWIKKGQITHPVSEITIGGNLKDMFASLSAANDLQFRYGLDAPTIKIAQMTIAGA